MTTRVTSIAGVVRDQRSLPVDGATIMVFPTNQNWWSDFGPSSIRTRESSTDSGRGFQFKNLPPGDHHVIALPGAPPDNWLRPEGLRELLPASSRVHLDSGSNVTVDLKIKG